MKSFIGNREAASILLCASLMFPGLATTAGAQWLPAQSAWGARMTMEPVIAAYGGFSALCNPLAARRTGWGVDQIAKVLTLTASQRALLDDLRTATSKAVDLSDAVCPRQIPRNSRDKLIFIERRLTALLQAVTTIKPAFEAFQGSLTEDQKAQLDRGPRRWMWRR
jgi:hypothetical protein